MKKKPGKLSLHRETLRALDETAVRYAAGASVDAGDCVSEPSCIICTEKSNCYGDTCRPRGCIDYQG